MTTANVVLSCKPNANVFVEKLRIALNQIQFHDFQFFDFFILKIIFLSSGHFFYPGEILKVSKAMTHRSEIDSPND